MKLSEKLILSTLDVPECLSFLEGATAERIGKSIAALKMKQAKATKSNAGSLLGDVVNDLQRIKLSLKGKERKIIKKDISHLIGVMKVLGYKVPPRMDYIIK